MSFQLADGHPEGKIEIVVGKRIHRRAELDCQKNDTGQQCGFISLIEPFT